MANERMGEARKGRLAYQSALYTRLETSTVKQKSLELEWAVWLYSRSLRFDSALLAGTGDGGGGPVCSCENGSTDKLHHGDKATLFG